MRVTPESLNVLLAVRTWLLGLYMFAWTTSCLLSIVVNDGRRLIDGPGQWIAAGALTITSCLALATVSSDRVRNFVIEPSRQEFYKPEPFLFVGLITAALAAEFLFAG